MLLLDAPLSKERAIKNHMSTSTEHPVIFGFDDALHAGTVGGKFYHLAQLAQTHTVPPAVCLSVEVFQKVLRTEEPIASLLAETTKRLYQSRGYQLDKHTTHLTRVLRQLEVPTTVAMALRQRLEDSCSDEEGLFPLAVRSSAVSEDQPGQTQAGIYESTLSLTDWSSVLKAIASCWASYYSYRAIVHRLLSNNLDTTPQMAVIVQKMVKGQWSGIAFSRSPIPAPQLATPTGSWGYIELTSGLNEALASGTQQGLGAFFSFRDEQLAVVPDARPLPIDATFAISAACRTARQLETHFHGPVDLEWTWTTETGLCLLQTRSALVCRPNSMESGTPCCQFWDLYEMPRSPDLDFGDCEEIYRHWSVKRGPLRQRAAKFGIALGGVAALEANLAGVLATEIVDCPALSRLGTSGLTLDAGSRIRQLEIARTDLQSCLAELLRSRSQSLWTKQVFLLREYALGTASLLSTIQAEETVLVEFALCPLAELTRGFAQVWRILISPQNELVQLNPDTWSSELLDSFVYLQSQATQLAHFTRAEAKLHADICLEWVIERGQLVLVDASSLQGTNNVLKAQNHRTLSPGFLQGKVVRVEMDAWLEELSNSASISLNEVPLEIYEDEKIRQILAEIRANGKHDTVIVAARPITALAAFVGEVAGFVFENGPLLCHLGILLREKNIPAFFSYEAFHQMNSGQYVLMSEHYFSLT